MDSTRQPVGQPVQSTVGGARRSLWDFLAAVWRRKWLTAAVAFACAALLVQRLQYSTADVIREARAAGFAKAVLPPGSWGLPVIGESLDLMLRDGYQFWDRRVAKYNSTVFHTHLFGERAIGLVGADEAAVLFDPERITRWHALPPHVRAIVFGTGGVNAIDDEEHRHRKSIIMRSFDGPHLRRYANSLEARLMPFFKTLEDTIINGHTFEWVTVYRQFCAQISSHLFWGIPFSEAPEDANGQPDLRMSRADLSRHLGNLMDAIGGLPLPLPGFKMGRALSSRDSLMSAAGDLVREFRKRFDSGDPAVADRTDVLANLGTAPDFKSTHRFSPEIVATDLINVARPALAISNLMTFALVALLDHPLLLERLRAEVAQEWPDGPLTYDVLERLQFTEQLVNETRRYFPFTPLLGGRVRESFTWRGFFFPKGWPLMLGIHSTHHDPRIWTNPEKFDPDRFGPGREEHKRHEYTLLQHGGRDQKYHRCAGEQFSTLLLKATLAIMARDYDWRLAPGQDLTIDMADIPPQPRSRVVFDRFHRREMSEFNPSLETVV